VKLISKIYIFYLLKLYLLQKLCHVNVSVKEILKIYLFYSVKLSDSRIVIKQITKINLHKSKTKYDLQMTLKIWKSRSVVQVDGSHCPLQFLSEPCFCRWLTYRDIWVDRLKWPTVYINLLITSVRSLVGPIFVIFCFHTHELNF